MIEEKYENLIYRGMGNYKGWKCICCGCGLLQFEKNGEMIKAYRGWEVEDWVNECWNEIKEIIDNLKS